MMSMISLSMVILTLAIIGIVYNYRFNLFILILSLELSFVAINLIIYSVMLLTGDYSYVGQLVILIAVSSAESAVIVTLLILLK